MESSYQSESGFSREFTRLTHQISSQIQQITKNVAQIQRMVSMLGTSQDSDQLRQRLHDVQHQSHTLSQTTMAALKDLTALAQPSGVGVAQSRQWKLQRERLMNEFSVVLNNFQSAQRAAATKEKADVSRARIDAKYAGRSLIDTEPSPVPESGPATIQIEQNVDLQTLREKEQSLRQLEEDIVDVNQIFKDLALMVHQQGEVVDSIEGNIESAVGHVDRGGSNLRQAADYQRRARRKQMLCLVAIALVVLFVALIVYLSTRSQSSNSR